MNWEEILREMASLSDEEFHAKVIGVLEELYQREAENLYRRLEILRFKLQRHLMCGC